MLVEPAGHWSVYKQIFFDHWESIQRVHPRYQTAYYDGLVAKMLTGFDAAGLAAATPRRWATSNTVASSAGWASTWCR